jgi:FSR family fosmidomycin resistance protein-like MFS transporter
VVPVSAPELLDTFSLSPAMAAGWTLVCLQIVSTVLEAPLLALADGRSKHWFIAGGLLCTGASCLLAAVAPSYPLLLAALLLYGPASGVGVALSQAALVDRAPGQVDRTLARWSLLGEIGDLAAPFALAFSVWLGMSWRGALGAAGLLMVAQGVVVAATWRNGAVAGAAGEEEGGEAPPRTANLRGLILWSLAGILCAFLDEILVAFGSLYLDSALAAGPGARALVFTGGALGAIAGTAATERLLDRVPPRRALILCSAGCAVSFAGWLLAPNLALSTAAMAATGFFAAPMYPITKAEAYAAWPGRTGAVNAIAAVLTPVEAALPVAIGLVADRFGLTAAVALLLAQPFGLVLVALWVRPARSRR